MTEHCNVEPQQHGANCHAEKGRPDYLLWGSLLTAVFLYILHWQFSSQINSITALASISQSTFDLMNMIWWGIAMGMLMVAVLTKVPREFVVSLLGTGNGLRGILRATLGGVLLDLCSHGILMVGAKLYERGVSTGQVMAFLVASPWNSFSLTLILIALIGLQWTLLFIVASMLVAIITGYIFDKLVTAKVLPENIHEIDLPKDFQFWPEAKSRFTNTKFTSAFFLTMVKDGIVESRMVLRWILFGVLLAGLVRTFMDAESFQTYFGPTVAGLGLTLIAATVIEVCSEGSTPIAADILTRANAPGNGFAFLMTGVATDYTEIMVLRDTTKSWKTALFLPLITVPQVVLLAWLINLSATGS
ncbi:MAG: permease [Gammaproteobacteria bacterium]